MSGRRRFNFISSELEKRISQGQRDQILQEHKGRILPDNAPQVRKVRQVLDRYASLGSHLHTMASRLTGMQFRLIPASGLQDPDWEVFVIQSDEQNAFVIPGYVGLIPPCMVKKMLLCVKLC